ncbi:hypothetical protein GLOIN_2v1779851 [Rhizophagus irregularis DAOM 181602=DAOM 197198]|uniref:Uncharacterized protein n=1 Tax=Rhizophagus irregularis (strain DAOM 181602 / DAOM 197198 / MUCL 43194) TaxID=747089 RepID=A0A2P4PNL1_RHIID|nr:hypothetical protein GLOIN_2v1779851 [Rhizophagus irregularis DAOM 181602=DAOM 197198]POG66981.1 hypothetical protein GLOIN_2v1779851 [Rhizophagus irregularis DAOM 181602=DAOM 197198]|eukprot:XP_025173847.1 hypothetical protein GLOIN_2v1779851 [Rhizophagus irregularis DAOM 181602=DAOM 197198]
MIQLKFLDDCQDLPKNLPNATLRKACSPFGWASEVQKLQRFVWPFRCGGLPKNENPKVKIHLGGLLKNENPKVQVDFRRTEKGGPLRFVQSVSSKEWKKLRFVNMNLIQWASEEQRKTKIRKQVSGSLKKVEPRFVSLVSQVDSDKQKKPKIRNFGGFPKDQDS